MIADFGVVKNTFDGLHPILIQYLTGRGDHLGRQRCAGIGFGKSAEIAAHGAEVILRQTFGIGPRIGQQLVPLVKGLRDRQRVARTETKPAAGFALQRCEIVQLRRRLFAGLLGFLHDARLAGASFDHSTGFGLGPNPFCSRLIIAFGLGKFFTKPAAFIAARIHLKLRMHLPVIARYKITDGTFAFAEDRQRGRLHAAGGSHVEPAMARVERRQCSRPIQSHEPVTLRSAQGCIGQRLHAAIFPQSIKSFDDRAICHRLHPHALERFIHLGQHHDVTKNQLSLATGIAGIHDGVYLLVADLPQYQLESALGFFNRLQVELIRDHRQMLDAPRQLFAVRSLGHFQLCQMPQRRGNDRRVVLVIIVLVLTLFRELTQLLA